ncbi:MAG TPA: hypothetical protein VK116_12165, partial [Planctomycetota bacterium]|nr:hypothetical protein [Planctomycetota bacterium]
LRPAGVAEIDGKRVDVVTSGRFIERDRRVRVVDTTGNRVVVREILEEEEDEKAKLEGLHEEGARPPAGERASPT